MSEGKHTKYAILQVPEPEKGHCPNCGGTVTEEMGYPKSTIGRTYDEYINKHFKREKITNKELK